MKHFYSIFTISLLIISTFSFAQNSKKKLDHSDYASWKKIEKEQISQNGQWAVCETNPARGDGRLDVFSLKKDEKLQFNRGAQAKFGPENNYIAFLVKPQFDTIRKLKIAKTKKDKLPKDSLFVFVFGADSIQKYEKVKSFSCPKDAGNWMAFMLDGYNPPADTTQADSTEKKPEKINTKKNGNRLVLLNPIEGKKHHFDRVKEFKISENGKMLSFIQTLGDSIDSVRVTVFDFGLERATNIIKREGYAKKLAVNASGDAAAFIYSADTVKQKVYDLFFWQKGDDAAKMIVSKETNSVPEGWAVSENGKTSFSKDGSKLWYATAPIPEKEAEDSLMKDEIARLDVWHWQDSKLQPQQKLQLKKEQKRSYRAVYHIEEQKSVQLCDMDMRDLRFPFEGNGDFALGTDSKNYEIVASWDGWYRDYYFVELKTGKREILLEKQASSAYLSPDGNYFAWYDQGDSCWKAKNTTDQEVKNLTAQIPHPFYNEKHDTPALPNPYGIAGWDKDNKHIFIYDRYDIWKIDPGMKEQPQNLTKNWGRKNKTSLRFTRLNREINYVPKEIMVKLFDKKTKMAGFAKVSTNKAGEPKVLIMEKASMGNLHKARYSDEMIWRKGNVQQYPELYAGNTGFKNEVLLTNTNPQQKEYNWMQEELVSWTSTDGTKLEGILYKPEDFDPNKKYPMLVYFYETYSDELYKYYSPAPSRSVINFPYFVSNGYLIFIPDIVYGTGYPGQDAYKAIVSGTLKMMERSYVDAEHMGIQGQSWGGYQVAYLVTQTNLYAAAEAGAPVSNMTSAYGGIRWGSGMSRMFQYEKTQSRIGGTLWEKPMQYLKNSPVFMTDKIETPLLIMHNDNDGAVPWYQGIELFVAMRRLQKPCWMLTYNGDSHNLKGENWGNRMDLSRRLQQFFDHYLKEAPAPKWMSEGVPAIKKGKDYGFDLE